MRLSEFKPGESQYDFENRRRRYVHTDGEANEWKVNEDIMWDVQYLYDTYPQYAGLPLFEKIVHSYEEDLSNNIVAYPYGDVQLTILQYITRLQQQLLERDMPDMLKDIAELKSRVKKLEESSDE